MRLRILLVAFALAALPGASGRAEAAPFSFVAFGDIPHCPPARPEDCAAEAGRVAALVGRINEARPAFSIFLGGARGAEDACTDAMLLGLLDRMGLSDAPLVYTPGNEEWTDCWRDEGGRHDPLERLALLRARFFPHALSLGREPMPVNRQADQQTAHRDVVENARWTHEDVVFATLHVVGSNNNRPTEPEERPEIIPPDGAMAEYEARHAANLDWLEATFREARRSAAPAVVLALHADLFHVQRCGSGHDSGFRAMREAIGRAAAAFGRPVLLIHGEGHAWLRDEPYPDAPNLTRLMVPGNRETPAVRVMVEPEATAPFAFSLMGPQGRPDQPGC